MKKVTKFFMFLPLIIIVGVAAVGIFGWIVMQLWNGVAVPVLHVSSISFWQGLGLLVLCRILFGSFGKGGGWRKREGKPAFSQWIRMSQQEKEEFKTYIKNKFGNSGQSC